MFNSIIFTAWISNDKKINVASINIGAYKLRKNIYYEIHIDFLIVTLAFIILYMKTI